MRTPFIAERLLPALPLIWGMAIPLMAEPIPLVSQDDEWRYREGRSAPQDDWRTVDDAGLDADWQAGPGGFGYASSASETINCNTLLPGMEDSFTTVHIRRQFTIDSPVATNLNLFFSMDWDDGFVAYLDGTNLVAHGEYDAAPIEPGYLETADGNHESSTGNSSPQPVETFDLGPAADWLPPGDHTLSIVGLNASSGSSDFILVPNLWLDEGDPHNPSTNEVSGTIAEDVFWTTNAGPYRVVGSLTVAPGATLFVEPGVEVQFDPGQGMTVLGRLLADGTEEEPIRFTRSTPGTTWERLLFVEAEDSLLRHCVIEFSDCEGDHKDYYDDDCDPATPPPSRTYFQAVVALACHLDIEYCTFQNLPDESGSPEGDAIAIISDDPDVPGHASAAIRHSEFLSIGQGVHTRFAYVLVEHCYFTDHHGDNDDIDLYGESIPPSLIRYNQLVNPSHDDMINPTRCSAILIGNEVGNCDDHGIVLRDYGRPVLINNRIYNCSSAGIAVQNQCDAFLFNNLIVNCSRGVRFFDHTGRWDPPYCLTPGSGRATLLNNIIWNCPTPLLLTDSPAAGDGHSQATAAYNIVEGGLAAASVSANATLTWGDGNQTGDPLFTDAGSGNFMPLPGSPAIDAGAAAAASFSITNHLGETATITITVTNDTTGLGRPLDGDGDGVAIPDIGPYEVLDADADSNRDGIPDGWYAGYGLNPADPDTGTGNPDLDPAENRAEFTADTDPQNPGSYLALHHVLPTPAASGTTIRFGPSSTNRVYTLHHTDDLHGDSWTDVDGAVDVPGNGAAEDALPAPNGGPRRLYRIEVRVP